MSSNFSLGPVWNRRLAIASVVLMPGSYYGLSWFTDGRVPFNPSVCYGMMTQAIGVFLIPTLDFSTEETRRRLALFVQVMSFGFYANWMWENIAFTDWLLNFRRSLLMGLGCGLQTATHSGPGNDITWEAWPSGKWCTYLDDEQFVTIGGGMTRYHQTIHKKRCYTACMNHLPADDKWHGYITSAPAGELPGNSYCAKGYYWGMCPAHENYRPEATNVGLDRDGGSIVMYPY